MARALHRVHCRADIFLALFPLTHAPTPLDAAGAAAALALLRAAARVQLAAGWLAMRLDMLGMFVLTLAGEAESRGGLHCTAMMTQAVRCAQ